MSEITLSVAKHYARVDGGEDDWLLQDVLLPAARDYVLGYTALTQEAADEKPQLAIACLAVCAHLYDHRGMAVERSAVNRVIDSILGCNAMNLVEGV